MADTGAEALRALLAEVRTWADDEQVTAYALSFALEQALAALESEQAQQRSAELWGEDGPSLSAMLLAYSLWLAQNDDAMHEFLDSGTTEARHRDLVDWFVDTRLEERE